MKVKIYRSITDIDKAKWDAIVDKNRIICTHSYIELIEKSGLNGGGCYYPVVYENDRILAHTCAYLTSAELDIFARGPLKKIVCFVRRIWKDFLIIRYVECGSPITTGNMISVDRLENTAEILNCLCSAVEDLARELGVKMVLLRDFYDNETKFRDFFIRRGYGNIHNLPKAEITVRWKNFSEYLDSMRSNYRRKIMKRIDKCAGFVKLSVRALQDLSGNYAQQMKQLHDDICLHAKEVQRNVPGVAFFQNINKHLGEKAAVVLAEKDGCMIGFMLMLISQEELLASAMGLDYEHNEEYFVYFNLFYKTIEFGIEKGMKKISLSITSLDPKKDMGSDIINLNMFMKHSNPVFNKALPLLFDLIAPPDTKGPRQVFKES